MTHFPQHNSQAQPWELGYATDNTHVFNFFNAVYAWMAVGLAVTAGVAWLVAQSTLVYALASPGISVAIFLGLAVISWFFSTIAEKVGPGVATGVFILYAAVLGAALSYIFLVYSLGTIGAAFAITGGTFAVMSVIGFVTKRDLSRIGGLLTMAMVGLFIASIVNVFMKSSGLSWIITYAVVIVFTGLIAWHTQWLRNAAIATQGNKRAAATYAIVGSLLLFVDFINIFVSLLRILGSKDE